ISTVISNEGRAKVKDHFGDIKDIPSLEALLTYLGNQVNSPFGTRSSGYRPSPQIIADARHKFASNTTQSGHSAKVGSDRVHKRPRFNGQNNGAKNTTHASTSNAGASPSTDHSNGKKCHYCKTFGHILETCPILQSKREREAKAATAGFSGGSAQNAAPPHAPAKDGFKKRNFKNYAKVNMVTSTPLKRSRDADDSVDSYGQDASGPGPLYEMGILDEDEVMNRMPDN
ncbi:hypothetical protein BGZ96_005730, partial [Linnemannia gamsii]